MGAALIGEATGTGAERVWKEGEEVSSITKVKDAPLSTIFSPPQLFSPAEKRERHNHDLVNGLSPIDSYP